MQSVNMGDRELCENVWFSTESRSENSSEWAVLLSPWSLIKPELKLFASINIVTFTPCKKWSDIRTSYTHSTVGNTLYNIINVIHERTT